MSVTAKMTALVTLGQGQTKDDALASVVQSLNVHEIVERASASTVSAGRGVPSGIVSLNVTFNAASQVEAEHAAGEALNATGMPWDSLKVTSREVTYR